MGGDVLGVEDEGGFGFSILDLRENFGHDCGGVWRPRRTHDALPTLAVSRRSTRAPRAGRLNTKMLLQLRQFIEQMGTGACATMKISQMKMFVGAVQI